MAPTEDSRTWSHAFATQACSDFKTRDVLLAAALPDCHQLHYLQMAFEKAANAHYVDRGDEVSALQSSHAYVAKAIPIIVKSMLSRTGRSKAAWLMEAVASLAQRIERLAPGVDAGGSVPANCEYPWRAPGGRIQIPCEHDFNIPMHAKAAITMIKAVRERALELSQETFS